MTVTNVQPDDAALRKVRRERVLAEMDAEGIDILITGRESNARYICGVPRLWLAGSRPFGPGCVLSRDTGEIHLVNTWDEGVPEDIPHENLHGITFNGQNTLAWLTAVAGASTAKTVATDGLMPSSAGLIQTAFPSAELVDGEAMMRRVRRIKLPEEVNAIRTSVRLRKKKAVESRTPDSRRAAHAHASFGSHSREDAPARAAPARVSAAIPHVFSRERNVEAVLFGYPLRAGQRSRGRNKILWIVGEPRNGQPLDMVPRRSVMP